MIPEEYQSKQPPMAKDAKIYVAGHRGMVGSAIVRELNRQGYTNIITRTHRELDLCRQDAVEEFFDMEKPEYVFWKLISIRICIRLQILQRK